MNNPNSKKIDVKTRSTSDRVKVGLKLAGLAATTTVLIGCADNSVDKAFEGPTDTYKVEGGDSVWGIASDVKQNIEGEAGSVTPYVDKVRELAGTTALIPNATIELPVAADINSEQPGIQLKGPNE